MSLTKAYTVVSNNTTMTAGAGAVTSANQVLTGCYAATARIRITNGSTGPTVAAQVQVQISEDTTSGDYMTLATVSGGTVNSAVTEFVVAIPDTAENVQFVSGSNTGQNCTLRIVLDTITSL